MERFSEALAEINAKYTYMERPRGSPAQQVRVVVCSQEQGWSGVAYAGRSNVGAQSCARRPTAPPHPQLPRGQGRAAAHCDCDFTEAATDTYAHCAPPTTHPQMQADVAVDAVARLVLNLKDGQPVSAEDAPLLLDCVAGGFWDSPGMVEEVRRSIAEREQRAGAYT